MSNFFDLGISELDDNLDAMSASDVLSARSNARDVMHDPMSPPEKKNAAVKISRMCTKSLMTRNGDDVGEIPNGYAGAGVAVLTADDRDGDYEPPADGFSPDYASDPGSDEG